ncbi:MAG TPA: methylated-DNA--[protein]-cysteine S-methyltransferase [Tepidisphaeraceae bacterium]|jgi:methylated-DNA-[protein]-cysteine S-methyltransferase
MERLSFTEIDSPTGRLRLIANDAALVAVLWQKEHSLPPYFAGASRDDEHSILNMAALQLGEYFERRRQTFDVLLEPHGTAFQKQVWLALREIPFGQTASYGQIARRIGMPTASRAVGAANGRNPLPIIVPCHRVIGSNGTLTGFGGGLQNKALLLSLEGVSIPMQQTQPLLAF